MFSPGKFNGAGPVGATKLSRSLRFPSVQPNIEVENAHLCDAARSACFPARARLPEESFTADLPAFKDDLQTVATFLIGPGPA